MAHHKAMTGRILELLDGIPNVSLRSWCLAARNSPGMKHCSNSFA
jgi:hypothetical protein